MLVVDNPEATANIVPLDTVVADEAPLHDKASVCKHRADNNWRTSCGIKSRKKNLQKEKLKRIVVKKKPNMAKRW